MAILWTTPGKKIYLQTRALHGLTIKYLRVVEIILCVSFLWFHAQVPTFLNKTFLPAVEPKRLKWMCFNSSQGFVWLGSYIWHSIRMFWKSTLCDSSLGTSVYYSLEEEKTFILASETNSKLHFFRLSANCVRTSRYYFVISSYSVTLLFFNFFFFNLFLLNIL